MFELLVISGYLLSRLPEQMLHKINKKSLVDHPAFKIEHPVVAFFYWFDLLLPVPLALMSFMCPLEMLDPLSRAGIMVAVFIGALFRISSMLSLGALFNLDCKWIEGAHPVRTGLYGIFRHPDSLGRSLEATGLAACLWFPFGPVFVVVSYALLIKLLIINENKCRPPEGFGSLLQSTGS